MQSAADTKHDLFLRLSEANQLLPKQLESFVDQLKNPSHHLQQVSAVSVLSVAPWSPFLGWWQQVPSAF